MIAFEHRLTIGPKPTTNPTFRMLTRPSSTQDKETSLQCRCNVFDESHDRTTLDPPRVAREHAKGKKVRNIPIR